MSQGPDDKGHTQEPPPASGQPRGNKRVLVIFAILGSVAVAALVGGAVYLIFSGHNTAGLEGIWRDPANPRHCHEFLPSGDIETWDGQKGSAANLKFPMARFATWRRDGQQITVRTTRGWDFVGQLDGAAIRGKTSIRDETGAVVNTADTVWQRD